MRLEAVRAVDGLADDLADSWGTEEAVRRADGSADRWAVARADAGAVACRDGRLRAVCGRVGGRPRGKNSCPPGGRPADDEADERAHFHRSERPSATPRP